MCPICFFSGILYSQTVAHIIAEVVLPTLDCNHYNLLNILWKGICSILKTTFYYLYANLLRHLV